LSGGPSSFGSVGNSTGIGNFTLKRFLNQSAFDEYIQNRKYGEADTPALCFGFKASENKTSNSYELELMFDDQQADYRGIPSQSS
jgi:hypothetical protein